MVKKTGYGVFVIVGIVILVAVALMYFSEASVGQAWKPGKYVVGITCYFDYPAGTPKEQMKTNWCKDDRWGNECRGPESCKIEFKEKYGQNFHVSSSCAGGHDVRVDGRGRELHFQCTPVQPIVKVLPTKICCAYQKPGETQITWETDSSKCEQYAKGGIKYDLSRCEELVCCQLKDGVKATNVVECGRNGGTSTSYKLCTEKTCMNGRVDPLEKCQKNADCPATSVCKDCLCVNTACGDGVKEGLEECEKNSDCPEGKGCWINKEVNICKCVIPDCGNNRIEGTEECDDGNTFSNDGCSATCKKEETKHLLQCVPLGTEYQTIFQYFGQPGVSCVNTKDADLGYLMAQIPSAYTYDLGEITYCKYYLRTSYFETDVKFMENCEEDSRPTEVYPPMTKTVMGYAFKTEKPNTRLAYKCVKDYGVNNVHNFRVSFSADCNAGTTGWEGYQNKGTLGYWLTTATAP